MRFGRGSRPGKCVRRVDGDQWGLTMSAGLLWRTILFLGLTFGYTILAALAYSV
jgi:hypothetical protein